MAHFQKKMWSEARSGKSHHPVARVFWVVATVFWVVARCFLGYSGWLLWCCYAVARVLWVVAKVLLGGCWGVLDGWRFTSHDHFSQKNILPAEHVSGPKVLDLELSIHTHRLCIITFWCYIT